MKIKYLTILAVHAYFSLSALGDVITPVAATSASTVGAPRTIDKAIDGSGLVKQTDALSVLDDTHVYGADNLWLSSSSAVSGGVEELTFDLGGTYNIDTVHHWAFPEFPQPSNVRSTDTRPFWETAANSPRDRGFHWNQNARSYFRVGKALGDDMVTLLNQ